MSDVEVLEGISAYAIVDDTWSLHTLIPSSEKHGGTAELSSSASLNRIGNFSTADIGISPL